MVNKVDNYKYCVLDRVRMLLEYIFLSYLAWSLSHHRHRIDRLFVLLYLLSICVVLQILLILRFLVLCISSVSTIDQSDNLLVTNLLSYKTQKTLNNTLKFEAKSTQPCKSNQAKPKESSTRMRTTADFQVKNSAGS